MSDDQLEPGGITERFRAFAEATDPEPDRRNRVMLAAAGGAILLVLIVVVVMLAL
jgi:hypothetical protein